MQISASIKPEQNEELSRHAKRLQRSKSFVVAQAIEEFLSNHRSELKRGPRLNSK